MKLLQFQEKSCNCEGMRSDFYYIGHSYIRKHLKRNFPILMISVICLNSYYKEIKIQKDFKEDLSIFAVSFLINYRAIFEEEKRT